MPEFSARHSPEYHSFSCPFFFFFISPRIACKAQFFSVFYPFAPLIEKGRKNQAKNKDNGKKGEKGHEKGCGKGLL
jgi:hypothetical protein